MSDTSEAPAEIQPTSSIVNNKEKRYTIPGRWGLLPGNPGRPKGSKNKSTQVRELLLACANRDTARIFRNHLRRPQSKGEFTKALDQLICILGPSKPLALIDQSQHTHFTVVLDGQPAAQTDNGQTNP